MRGQRKCAMGRMRAKQTGELGGSGSLILGGLSEGGGREMFQV